MYIYKKTSQEQFCLGYINDESLRTIIFIKVYFITYTLNIFS